MKNLEIAALNDCPVWFYGMASQKEVLFFKLEVHSLDCYSLSFFLYSPSLSPSFPSVSFLFIMEKLVPGKRYRIPYSLYVI